MSSETDELRRRVDRLEAVAEADKETRRAEMSAMTSSLDKGLAENRAANQEAIARNEAALARYEAATKEGLAQNREAIARHEAAVERLRTDMYKAVFAVIGAVGVFIAILGIFLKQ